MSTMSDNDLCLLFETIGQHVELDSVMLVGARCRDIHQMKYRESSPSRTTKDVDLALAVGGWEPLTNLRQHFPATSAAWQKLEVEGLPVDVVPFGELEKPPGEIASADGHVLNVAGFQEAFDAREFLRLSNGLRIAIPSVAGLAALKLHAWLDRHPRGEFKDATDIALILAWYEEADSLWDRFDEIADQSCIGETDRMAAAILGRQVRLVLGQAAAKELSERFDEETAEDLDLFAEKLVADGEQMHPFQRRRLQVSNLIAELVDYNDGYEY
ncbi:putative nucleotidyltransferase [Corynebacterium mucifaciens]